MERNQLHITRVDCEFYPNLQEWFSDVSAKWTEQNPEEAKAAPAAPPAGDAVPAEGEATAVAAAEPAADAVPPAAEPAQKARSIRRWPRTPALQPIRRQRAKRRRRRQVQPARDL